MKDEDVIPALRRHETVYGRTVIGLPSGTAHATGPMLQATGLVCAGGFGKSLSCSSVAESRPTIAAGADTFVFYSKHVVTFRENGKPVGHLGPATISLQVGPSS
jgi:hypothetical protein